MQQLSAPFCVGEGGPSFWEQFQTWQYDAQAATCGSGRAESRKKCREKVVGSPELVQREQGRQGRDIQLCHQAWPLPRKQLQYLLNAGVTSAHGTHVEQPLQCELIMHRPGPLGAFTVWGHVFTCKVSAAPPRCSLYLRLQKPPSNSTPSGGQSEAV